LFILGGACFNLMCGGKERGGGRLKERGKSERLAKIKVLWY